MRHRRLTRLVLWVALVSMARAGPGEQLPLKLYTSSNGLPSDRVLCILPDSHGYLWVGTSNGLSRFDGYTFTSSTASDALPGVSIRALLEARDGTFWAATDAGVVHWDPLRERSPRLRFIHVAAGKPADDVRALAQDGSGALWLGTRNGLYRLDRSGPSWRLRRSRVESPESGAAASVNALIRDRKGNLWIAAEGGLFRRRPEGAVQRAGGEGGPRFVRSLLEDRAGSVWAGTQGFGVYELLSGDGGAEIRVRPALTVESGLAGQYAPALFQTEDGKIWIGCFGGLTEIAADRSSIRSYGAAEGLSGIAIRSLAEDRNGNLWIGSDDAGLMRLAHNGFRKFDARDGLSSTRIGALFEDRAGELCAFTRGTRSDEIVSDASFLECFDGSKFHSARPRLLPGGSFGWGRSQIVVQDRRGEWWLPSVAGVYRFPAVAFQRLDTAAPLRIYTQRDGLPSGVVSRLFLDRSENLWVGMVTSDSRLAVWSRATDSFRSFSAKDGVPREEPAAFAEDRSGAVWIGFDSGLARFRRGAVDFFRAADGLPKGGIEALYVDGRGRLWLATDGGAVARIERPEQDRPAFVTYGAAQGLSAGAASSLTEDRWGRIYVGTPHGLDRFDPRAGVTDHFTDDDGLAYGLIETSIRDRQGNLWFGSTAGLSRLEPAASAPRMSPPILITRVFAGGVRLPLPELGSSDVDLGATGSESTPVQIDFLSLDFTPGERPDYQFLLDGSDRGWSHETEQPSVLYGRLPAGRHRFRVRAVAKGGSISPVPAQVRFTVLSPPWRRPEVLIPIFLAVAALAYLLHRYRLTHALAVERMRIRVATDLHDDIGAGLSEIAILSEVARREHGSGGSGPALVEIGVSARRLVDSMSDIVWSTDPRKDDMSSLAQRIRVFAANALESQGVRWNLEIPPEFEARRVDPETRRQMFMIVKEALANVARHSGCGRASIRMDPGANSVSVEIEDDGRGFSTYEATPGHGLANMRARALSLGGDLEIRPRQGGGTVVTARLPLR